MFSRNSETEGKYPHSPGEEQTAEHGVAGDIDPAIPMTFGLDSLT